MKRSTMPWLSGTYNDEPTNIRLATFAIDTGFMSSLTTEAIRGAFTGGGPMTVAGEETLAGRTIYVVEEGDDTRSEIREIFDSPAAATEAVDGWKKRYPARTYVAAYARVTVYAVDVYIDYVSNLFHRVVINTRYGSIVHSNYNPQTSPAPEKIVEYVTLGDKPQAKCRVAYVVISQEQAADFVKDAYTEWRRCFNIT